MMSNHNEEFNQLTDAYLHRFGEKLNLVCSGMNEDFFKIDIYQIGDDELFNVVVSQPVDIIGHSAIAHLYCQESFSECIELGNKVLDLMFPGQIIKKWEEKTVLVIFPNIAITPSLAEAVIKSGGSLDTLIENDKKLQMSVLGED